MNDAPLHWESMELGGFLKERQDRVGEQTLLPVLSVTKHQGAVPARERFSRALHGKDLSNYRVARRNNVIIDPMLLWDGVITVQYRFEAGIVSPDYRVFELAPCVDPVFFSYLAKTPGLRHQYKSAARGTNVRRRRIHRDDFLRIKASVPPLPEQRKIATILSSVDECIEKTEAVIDQLEILKKGLLSELLTRGMPGWHKLSGQAPRGVLPSTWEVVLLDSVAKRGSGHTPDKKHPEYWDGHIKWISLKDSPSLDRLYISDTASRITPLGIENSSAVEHPAGTVVLSRDASVGRSAITTDVMAVSQHFMTWRCGPRLDSHFLYYWLQSMKPEFERIAIGSTIKTIGLPYFKRLHIPLPTIEEQKEIARTLTAMDKRIFAEEAVVTGMRHVKTALLDGLLSGRVRVNISGQEAA